MAPDFSAPGAATPPSEAGPASVRIEPVRCEHHREALGIGEASPRLSWRLTAPAGWVQAAYEIEVARASGTVTSGRVDSAQQVLVAWPTSPLASREAASVRVRVWAADGGPSPWSAPAAVEAGLLRPTDWVARAIAPDWAEDREAMRPGPLLRRTFTVGDGAGVGLGIARARLYATAHGLVDLEINGTRVGDHEFTPGWTAYSARLRYVTHDVTHLLRPGANAIGAWLGDGWYRGRLGFGGGQGNLYGDEVALLAQLEIACTDGSTAVIATDSSWRAAIGPILSSGIYDGEHYDARLARPGWSSPEFDEAAGGGPWHGVRVVDRDPATLVAPQGPPVRCTGELAPVAVTTSPSGRTIVDFGQNHAGRLRITVRGNAGDTVQIRHAEVLQDGELDTRPLRHAAATDRYTLRGGGEESWEPRFTFHGFRYAEIEGWTGGPIEHNVRSRVVHSDMERTGWFECSEPLVNRLHENVVWSMRSNTLDVPTDCPQRDERLGWTGDVQVFAPTASFLYDCSGFFASWLADLAHEQAEDGTVPWYVPVVPGGDMWTPIRPAAVWGDAAVLTPWDLYQRFGDAKILAEQYNSARAWVDLEARLAGADHLWNTGMQLGDWLDPTAPAEDPAGGASDRYYVANVYAERSARRLADMAQVLGHNADAQEYAALANRLQHATRAEYDDERGVPRDDSQTSLALAIIFGADRGAEALAAAGNRLAELVAAAGNRISTGFVGTPIVCDALTRTGHLDAAYALLLQRECPSWLYTVLSGGTTIWERWDSQLPDGRTNPGIMTSFNHYALGAVADWLHRVVAGLAPAEPGYRTVRFAPQPGGGLTWANARYESAYGSNEVSWALADDTFTLRVVVPPGARGIVELPSIVDVPGSHTVNVGPGTHEFVERLVR